MRMHQHDNELTLTLILLVNSDRTISLEPDYRQRTIGCFDSYQAAHN